MGGANWEKKPTPEGADRQSEPRFAANTVRFHDTADTTMSSGVQGSAFDMVGVWTSSVMAQVITVLCLRGMAGALHSSFGKTR